MSVQNNVALIGRLCKDPDLKFQAGTGNAVATFTLAVDRNYTNQQGQREADFINCVAFKKTAELIANNLTKGRLIAVSGSIRTGKYQAQDGTTRYTTDVIVDEVKFLEKKEGHRQEEAPEGFQPVEGDPDIPF
jgi:single-strand DNA-binding protein